MFTLAQAAVSNTTQAQNIWQTTLMTVLSLVITYYLVPLLKRKADEASSAAAKADVEKGAAIADRVKSFLYGSAAAIAEKRFPVLAQQIVTGQMKTVDQVKGEMKSWGVELKGDAVRYFNNQDIDIAGELGDEFINKLIERAANAASPLPGMETAKTLLQKEVADVLVKKGVEYVKAQAAAGEIECKACIPVCAGCK